MNPLDDGDPLKAFRARFVIDDGTIYLDGNSLGRLPLETVELLRRLVERGWGERLVRGWSDGWVELPRRLGDRIAGLIGVSEGDVVVTDSTSVNFFKLALAALKERSGRTRIVTEATNFPSDLYLLQGIVRTLGEQHQIVSVESPDGIHLPPESIEHELDDRCALLTLSHTAFKSGYVHDMRRLTQAAHQVGALVLWDLSHSVGAMPLFLEACGVDMAVGCTYKYLNGGPGAPAFLYVRRELQDRLMSPIAGWFGQRNPFAFGTDYVPASGIDRFLAGTPPILSMAAIEPGLSMVEEAGLDRIRAKSLAQTEYLVELWRERLTPLGFALHSPLESAQRGSHVSLGHPEAYRIDQALIQNYGVIPDFRSPDNIRFGVSPLYTTFDEIERAMNATCAIVRSGEYEKFPCDALGVT